MAASDRAQAVWQALCDTIFQELGAGRGIIVPELGTFAIDVKTHYLGTGGTTEEWRPALVLSAAFSGSARLPQRVRRAPRHTWSAGDRSRSDAGLTVT